MLKPHDLAVVLFYALHPTQVISIAGVGTLVGLSGAEAHGALERCARAGLMIADRKRAQRMRMVMVNKKAVIEFVTHGVRYVYFAQRGPLMRGVPTAQGAAPLSAHIRSTGTVPVWPDPEGTVLGESFEPLYKTAPVAARASSRMYAALALIDAIRGGHARERSLAADLFEQLLLAKPGDRGDHAT